MKIIKLIMLLVALAIASCGNPNPETTANAEIPESTEEQREFYQLKIYSFGSEEQVNATDAYLKNAFIPAVKKQGIDKVGVFKSRVTETDTVQKTYVLLPFESLDDFQALENKILEDSTYLAAGSAYIDANYDNPPYSHIESILMQAFSDMPQMGTPDLDGPRAERIYELRSYESPTEQYYRNKVDMFNAGGEVKLFLPIRFQRCVLWRSTFRAQNAQFNVYDHPSRYGHQR